MNNMNSIIKERIETFSSQYLKIREEFKDVASALKKFEHTPLTRDVIDECQMIIDDFLYINNLKISVYVAEYEQGIVVLGRTILDEIVWESIQDSAIKKDYHV